MRSWQKDENKKINRQKIQNHQNRQDIAAAHRLMPPALQDVGQ